MRTLRQSGVFAFASIGVGAVLLAGYAGWLQPYEAIEFSGLILAAILTSALALQQSATEDRATMPLSFVIDFISLLLFGPHATMLVVAAGAIAQGLTDSQRAHPVRPVFLNAATGMVAAQAAGAAHLALGGTMGHFMWPWQAVPIAAAIVAYCFVRSVSGEVIAPLFARRPVNRSWPKRFLTSCPTYVIGASVAVALVEVIDHRMWEVSLVAAVPLLFTYRAYSAYLGRLEGEHRHREVLESREQGMSVVDSNGLVTLWDDALERIADCPRERALGRSLVGAVPSLAKTELPRAIT